MTASRPPGTSRGTPEATGDETMPDDLLALADDILVAQQRIRRIDVTPAERVELSRELRRAVAVGRRDPGRGRVLIGLLVGRTAPHEAPTD